MKRIGFLSFGHWQPRSGSQTRTASDTLMQTIELAQAAEEIGLDGAYVRVHHFERQLSSPFPLLPPSPRRRAGSRSAPPSSTCGTRTRCTSVRAADTVLFTVPNQLGVAYNARILGTIARHIAPALGWTPAVIKT
jgi:hypothetical protein